MTPVTVYLDPLDWTAYSDPISYLFTIEPLVDVNGVVKGLSEKRAGASRALRSHAGAAGRISAESIHAPDSIEQEADATAPQTARWTVPEVGLRIASEGCSSPGHWAAYLPPSLPEGKTYALLVEGGYQARCLAKMLAEGVINKARPLETFPMASYLAECSAILEGSVDRQEARIENVRQTVLGDLRRIGSGWEPSLPPTMSPEEWSWCAGLAKSVIDSKPRSVRRRGSEDDMASVLRFLVLCSKGWLAQFTQATAVKHLGWASWEPDEDDPAVDAARKRLSRSLKWITEGTEDHGKLDIPALVLRTKTGYSHEASGEAAPSRYRMLWQNWGGPFLQRHIDQQAKNN